MKNTNTSVETCRSRAAVAEQTPSRAVGLPLRDVVPLRRLVGTADPDRGTEGIGLQNIRDRVEDLGGSFKIAYSPGCGAVPDPGPALADESPPISQ